MIAQTRMLIGGGILMAMALSVRSARATTYYWDGLTAFWTDPVSWSTTNTMPPTVSGGVPGSGDTATFNASGVVGSQSVILYSGATTNVPTFINGLIFNAPASVSINAGATNNGGLAIGALGISDSASAAAVTINSIMVGLTANQPWSLASNFTIQSTINLGSFSLNLSSPSSWSFSGQITGGAAGGMFLSGGTISLSGNNNYGGNTIVNGGCFVNVLNPQALGTVGGGTPANGGTTVAVNSTVNFNGQSTVAEPLSITGTGVNGVGAIINSDVSLNPVNLTGSITIAGSASVGGTSPLTLSSSVSSNDGLTAVTLTKVGTGTLTLSGALNNAALAVSISSGALVLAKSSSNSVHAVNAGLTIGSGATARLAGSGGDQISDTAAVTDNGTFDLNGQAEAIDGLSGSGIITNTSASTNAILVVGTSNASNTFGGTIQNGSSPVILYKSGNGTLTLTGPNTFSGGTNINGGTLILGSAQALGAASATINAGTLDLHGQAVGANSFGLSAALINSSSTPVTLSGNVNGIVGGSIGGSGNITISGVFTGSTVYNGSGTLTLAGSASNGGDVSVNSGRVVLAKISSASVYAVHKLLVFGGTVQLAGTGSFQLDPNGFFSMNTGGTLDLNGQNLNAGSGSFFGGTVINTAAGTIAVISASVNSISTTFHDGAGKLGFTDAYDGPTQIGAADTYSGPTTIAAGTLSFQSQNEAPAQSAFVVLAGATFSLLGINQSIGSLSGAGSLTGNYNNSVLTVGNDNSSTTFSGPISDSTGMAGVTFSLIKTGTGTLTLTGNNTFTGPLTVSAGSLLIGTSASLGTPSAIAIVAGATLDLGGAAPGSVPLTLQGTLLNSGALPTTFTGNVNNAVAGSATVSGLGQITFAGGFNNSSGATTITKTGFNSLAFAGTADDTNLSLTINAGTALLGKTSSPTVHSIGGNLVINGGATVYLAGTGGDQIADTSTVTVNGTFDLYGHGETIGSLGGGGLITNSVGTTTLTVGGGGLSTGYTGLVQNGAGTLVLNKTGAGTASFIGANGISVAVNDSQGSVAFFSTEHLGGLSISAGAKTQLAFILNGPASLIVTPSLSVAGTLDLANGGLLVESSAANFAADFANVRTMLTTGHNGSGAGHTWNSTGITSSAATQTGTELEGLALTTGSAYLAAHGPSATFEGQAVDAYSILVMFTYAGDATLDGRISIDDYLALDRGFITHATGYANGDFNYDGTVDFKDYALIDNAYKNQSGTLADGEIALHAAEFGQPYLDALSGAAAAVPEPASLFLLAPALALLARRRRSKH